MATHRVFTFYLRYNWDVHVLNIVLFVVYLGWLLASIRRIKKYHHDKKASSAIPATPPANPC